MSNFIKNSVGLILLFVITGSAYGGTVWPQGTSFVALTEGEWKLYIVTDTTSGPQQVATNMEPRTPAFSPAGKKIAYIGADGSLREIDMQTQIEKVLVTPDEERSYTQPVYSTDGERLFVIELKAGASVDTDVGMFGSDRKNYTLVVSQRSAQFEPYFQPPNNIIYSNVHCTIGCSRIIQEIWRINILTMEARQITLLNAISRQPVLSKDARWLYFSSDKAGHYHIWRLDMQNGEYKQLTQGVVTDVNPAIDHEGNLYFIRHSPTGTQVLQLSSTGEVKEMSLPVFASDVRDMEISQ